MSAGVPGQIIGFTNVTSLVQFLQRILKPAAFEDITFADIAGADVDGNGNLIVSVSVDGKTIGGDGTPANPLFVIQPILAKGKQAVAQGLFSVPVVLNPAIPHTALFALPSWNSTCYFTADAPAGFTINFGTSAPVGGGNVYWLIV